MQLGHYLVILLFVFILLSAATHKHDTLSSVFQFLALICGVFAASMLAI